MWEGDSAQAYCLIHFLTVRFPLWTNKGNAIMSSTETATFYLKYLLGGDSRAPHPLYEALAAQ